MKQSLAIDDSSAIPELLTAPEAAQYLRSSKRAPSPFGLRQQDRVHKDGRGTRFKKSTLTGFFQIICN